MKTSTTETCPIIFDQRTVVTTYMLFNGQPFTFIDTLNFKSVQPWLVFNDPFLIFDLCVVADVQVQANSKAGNRCRSSHFYESAEFLT